MPLRAFQKGFESVLAEGLRLAQADEAQQVLQLADLNLAITTSSLYGGQEAVGQHTGVALSPQEAAAAAAAEAAGAEAVSNWSGQ
jgi:hypothetical protein